MAEYLYKFYTALYPSNISPLPIMNLNSLLLPELLERRIVVARLLYLGQ